jgi:hypothetical protein
VVTLGSVLNRYATVLVLVRKLEMDRVLTDGMTQLFARPIREGEVEDLQVAFADVARVDY